MQENRFTSYLTLTSVSAPTPDGGQNSRGEPTYRIAAIGLSIVGSVRDPNTGIFSNEGREVDLYFMGLSAKHAGIISQDSQVFVDGGTVISFDSEVRYDPAKIPSLFDKTETEALTGVQLVERLIAKANFGPDVNTASLLKEVSRLLPAARRKTIVRVNADKWSLKASPKQIANAQSLYVEADIPL